MHLSIGGVFQLQVKWLLLEKQPIYRVEHHGGEHSAHNRLAQTVHYSAEWEGISVGLEPIEVQSGREGEVLLYVGIQGQSGGVLWHCSNNS